MQLSPNTPGYIAPGTKYPHVPNYDRRPAPNQATEQFRMGENMAKRFTDVRTGRSTILIDR